MLPRNRRASFQDACLSVKRLPGSPGGFASDSPLLHRAGAAQFVTHSSEKSSLRVILKCPSCPGSPAFIQKSTVRLVVARRNVPAQAANAVSSWLRNWNTDTHRQVLPSMPNSKSAASTIRGTLQEVH